MLLNANFARYRNVSWIELLHWIDRTWVTKKSWSIECGHFYALAKSLLLYLHKVELKFWIYINLKTCNVNTFVMWYLTVWSIYNYISHIFRCRGLLGGCCSSTHSYFCEGKARVETPWTEHYFICWIKEANYIP